MPSVVRAIRPVIVVMIWSSVRSSVIVAIPISCTTFINSVVISMWIYTSSDDIWHFVHDKTDSENMCIWCRFYTKELYFFLWRRPNPKMSKRQPILEEIQKKKARWQLDDPLLWEGNSLMTMYVGDFMMLNVHLWRNPFSNYKSKLSTWKIKVLNGMTHSVLLFRVIEHIFGPFLKPELASGKKTNIVRYEFLRECLD